jgi:hypothetical protein
VKVLDKILNNLTNVWNVLPKDVPALTIQQGTGIYPLVSVDTAQMYFHAVSYREDMPMAQTIYLDDYTLSELSDVINSMGYIATLTSEDPNNDNDYKVRKSYALIESYNVSLNPIATLDVFTASSWKLLYPIARAVSEFGKNVEDAVPQMVATLTTGKWVDYWATFFTSNRVSGERDSSLRTRIFMNLANLKTNNIALAELIGFAVKGKTTVRDISPGVFEISIDPSYMSTSADVHSIIKSTKGGGIKYYLNYKGLYNEEDYRASYPSSHAGVQFDKSDTLSMSVSRTLEEPEPFGMVQLNGSFTVGRDSVGTGGGVIQLIANPRTISDSATMTFTLNGAVTRTSDV